MRKKKFGPVFKELYNFLAKNLSLSSKKYGVGIRDMRSGKQPIPDPGPGAKKAPDPGSATQLKKSFGNTPQIFLRYV
jgi:hypothetical protein